MNGYLTGRGYSVNEKAMTIIDICDDWYANRITNFHRRQNLNGVEYTVARMNFAKRCCSDDANLCEIISVTSEEEAMQDFLETFLERNRFDVRYREQLERTSATGTVGAYIFLKNADYMQRADGSVNIKGGEIKINYCEASNIIPLTIDNGLVTECAFASTNIIRSKETTTLVIFTIEQDGRYLAETVKFDAKGGEIKEEYSSIKLGDVKPFAIMQNAEVNNLDNMDGYGLPKIYNAIPFFQALDLCYTLLYGDLDKGDKIVFINELLACVSKGEDGLPQLTAQQKELFILLGEKLPSQDSVIKEYNPTIRIDDITSSFELVLSLISMMFGTVRRNILLKTDRLQLPHNTLERSRTKSRSLTNSESRRTTIYAI